MEGGRQNLVADLINAAVLSGAYSALAQELPEAARGLERLYGKWHGHVEALCNEIGDAARLDTGADVAMQDRQTR